MPLPGPPCRTAEKHHHVTVATLLTSEPSLDLHDGSGRQCCAIR